jgi:hypothetical protein
MPYVPGKKTDGTSQNREKIDQAVEFLAEDAARRITNNLSLIDVYVNIFLETARCLIELIRTGKKSRTNESVALYLAMTIYKQSLNYNYEGAYLGELNYAITRFIQRVPNIKAAKGEWDSEFRYWIYAATITALIGVMDALPDRADGVRFGLNGVFEDIKDEYKRRVNTAYEAEQILKNGDCYTTPFFTKLVEVVDEQGLHVGHMEIMVKADKTLSKLDVLNGNIVLQMMP